MSIPKDMVPGKSSKGKVPEAESTPKELKENEKGWFGSIKRFNDKVAHIVVFNSKLLIFLMVLFFAYLLFASVFQKETFSIRHLNVHSSLESKGYNSEFIAKKISYNIALLVNEVPQKLFAMFSNEESKEKNDILYKRIMDKYLKKEIKIEMDVNIGGVNLPLQDITKTARRILNVKDKYLDGDITVEDSLIIMTLGFNSNGINKNYETIRYKYIPGGSVKMIDVVDSMTLDAAKFVLKQYDPLVTVLMDYNPEVIYSSGVNQWDQKVYKEKDRIQKLKELYLDEKNDEELAVWSHAVTGAYYSEKYEVVEYDKYLTYSIQHFEKAIDMDPSFVDIVGFDLANIYINLKDTVNVVRIYQWMIHSDPHNFGIVQQLLGIYSDQENSYAYYKLLETAFKEGLYIPEDEMDRSQFGKYKEEDKFKTLVERYNEKNKPFFNQ